MNSALDLIKSVQFVTQDAAYVVQQCEQLGAFDFVYDARTGLYFCQAKVMHVDLMAELHGLADCRVAIASLHRSVHQVADLYIERGLGMFRSRAKPVITCAKSFKVPDEFLNSLVRRDIRYLED